MEGGRGKKMRLETASVELGGSLIFILVMTVLRRWAEH